MSDYTSTPPRWAVHGPWPTEISQSRAAQAQFRATALDRIEKGECDCHCCKFHGEPNTSTEGVWMRQPTPKQKREHPTRDPITYLNKWPCWLATPKGEM